MWSPPAEGEGLAFDLSPASPQAAEICARRFARELPGVSLAESPAYRLVCEHHTWIVLLHERWCDAEWIAALGQRRAVLGAVACTNARLGAYLPAFVVLIAPSAKAKRLTIGVHRLNGTLAMVGNGRLDGGALGFDLRSVNRPGFVPAALIGRLDPSGLVLDSGRYLPIVMSRRPEPETQKSARYARKNR